MGRATGLHVLVAGLGLVVAAVGGVGHGGILKGFRHLKTRRGGPSIRKQPFDVTRADRGLASGGVGC
jgi:hypothetical protein